MISSSSFLFHGEVVQAVMPVIFGETTHHLTKKIKEHLETEKKSHIFARLVNNENWSVVSTENCFKIINSISTPFRLKLKEAMHIIWKKLSLNEQQKRVNISITVSPSLSKFVRNSFMLCFKVYWQLMIGEDTPEMNFVFMDLFLWNKT